MRKEREREVNKKLANHLLCTQCTYSDDSNWLCWVTDIEVVDGSRERDREKVRSLPQTAHLLILHFSTHLELTVMDKNGINITEIDTMNTDGN